MSIDELLIRLSLGRPRRPHIVSFKVYQSMKEAIGHYLETGQLRVNQWGRLERVTDD